MRMIWALLIFLGVTLWLCVLGISALVHRTRTLRKRHGDIPVRVLRPGKKRWTRGHGVWVSGVFAFRGSRAAWWEDLVAVTGATVREADAEARKKLHRLGDDPVVATLHVAGEETHLQVAASA